MHGAIPNILGRARLGSVALVRRAADDPPMVRRRRWEGRRPEGFTITRVTGRRRAACPSYPLTEQRRERRLVSWWTHHRRRLRGDRRERHARCGLADGGERIVRVRSLESGPAVAFGCRRADGARDGNV